MMNDALIRMAAFQWLEIMTQTKGEDFFWDDLSKGFEYNGERITLLGAKGIWKPKQMSLPISIVTSPNSPYADRVSDHGFMEYKYRGTDPYHSDNIGLRELYRRNIPLVYFFGTLPGKYIAFWPAYIQGDDIKNLSFYVALDTKASIDRTVQGQSVSDEDPNYGRRAYLTATIRQRVHQRAFRERVLQAYNRQCTLCRLRHSELLDAAHIIADLEEFGEPVIQNGLSLCKIHHAAFDSNIIGISPDFQIKVRSDILAEIDGPMLKFGIQSMDNQKIILPHHRRDWPDPDRLSARFGKFLNAG